MKAHIVDLIKTTNTSVLQIYTPENRICFSLMISHDMKTRLPWQTEWLWPDAQHAPDTYFLFVPLSYQPTEQQEETTKLPASQVSSLAFAPTTFVSESEFMVRQAATHEVRRETRGNDPRST